MKSFSFFSILFDDVMSRRRIFHRFSSRQAAECFAVASSKFNSIGRKESVGWKGSFNIQKLVKSKHCVVISSHIYEHVCGLRVETWGGSLR